MKKIFTLLFASFLGWGLQAQSSFQVLDPDNSDADVTNTTLDFWGDANTDLVKELSFKNTSAASKTVKMKRVFISGVNTSLPDQDTVTICWNVCLSPTWNATQTAGNVNVAAGATISYAGTGVGFHSTFQPCTLTGTRTVRYTFWDINNTNDSVSVTFNYHITPTSVAENNIRLFSFSNPQPNPADGITTIKYDFPFAAKAKIKVFNALGTQVKELRIEDQSGKVTMDTDELSNGIYFYSLIVNDKSVGTKRLIVAH